MPYRWRWALILAIATALDLLGRVAASFDFRRVMLLEAVLLPITGLLLARLLRHDPGESRSRALRVAAVWLFALGGLRAVLWSLGIPLMEANVATLGAALAALVIGIVRRRYRAPQPP